MSLYALLTILYRERDNVRGHLYYFLGWGLEDKKRGISCLDYLVKPWHA